MKQTSNLFVILFHLNHNFCNFEMRKCRGNLSQNTSKVQPRLHVAQRMTQPILHQTLQSRPVDCRAVTPKILTQGVDTDTLSHGIQVISMQRSFYYKYFVEQTYPTCYEKYYSTFNRKKSNIKFVSYDSVTFKVMTYYDT